MLRRLLAGLVALLLAMAVAVVLPLSRVIADGATQEVYTDRLADADRFATIADRALRDGRTERLDDELRQYRLVYGIDAWLLGPDGRTLLSSDGGPPPGEVLADPRVDLAERGVLPAPPDPATPVGPSRLLVAVPVGEGSESIGAVVTRSPLDALHRRIAVRWGLLAAVAAGVTGVLALLTVPFSRWLLRPLARLDATVAGLAAGRLSARVRLRAGPPEVRRLAASFDRMAEVVERTLERQQQFVADAGHQLRTPLTSLRLALDNLGALLPGDPHDPVHSEHAEAVGEAKAMGELLDGLLALTRLGAAPVVVEPLDALLGDAADGWRARCTRAGLSLALDVDPGLDVVAPAGGLRHLLDELVDNACRLSGGRAVRVSAHADGDDVVLAVEDDGRGLPAAQREAAVRRFWRAPEQQNTPGSGLGLAIVAELAAAAGGAASLHDAGPGLRVEIRLPRT